MAHAQPKRDMDERVTIPLDPEIALRELMKVAPEPEPAREAAADESEREQPLNK